MTPTRDLPSPPAWKDDSLSTLPAGEELASRLVEDIARKACGRIRELRVVCTDDLIILEGRARTYHAKQLAQEAVLEVTSGLPGLRNLIVVG